MFFKLGHYLHLDKRQIWELTLPQFNYYLKKCGEHIDFTVKVSTMGMQSLFGGGGTSTETVEREDGEYDGDYKVATAEDMEWLGNLLGG